MYTTKIKGKKSLTGFTWYEVFENGKSTGNSYNALDEAHAISMHKLLK